MPDELAAGAVPRPKAQLLQFPEKVLAGRVPILGGLHQGRVKVPLGPGTELGQVVGVKAEHWGTQGGDEGHVLPGVVHDLQNGQGHVHLGGSKEILAPFGIPGDALLPQGTDVVVEDHAGAAEQNHHITGPQGTHTVPLLHHQRLLQQGADAPGHKPGLQAVLVLLLSLLVPQVGEVQGVKLQGVVPTLRELCSGHQGLVVGVVQLAQLGGHNVPEQIVAPLQHLLAGAEIPGQHPLAGLPLLGFVSGDKAAVLVQEDGGVGQSEAVDGLFHVAHLKEGAALSGDGGKDGVLHLVGVLVLVHHHLFKARAPHLSQSGGLSRGLHQEFDGKVLQVGEIQHPTPGFLGLIGFLKVKNQVHKAPHCRGGLPQIGEHLGAVPVKALGRLGKQVLGRVPQVLHLLGHCRRPALLQGTELFAAFPLASHRREGYGQTGTGLIPVGTLRRLTERLSGLQGGLDGGGVVHLQQLVLGAEVESPLQTALCLPALPGGVLQQQSPPGGLPCVGYPLQRPHRLLPEKPLGRVGVALDAAKYIQHNLLQAAVVPACRQGVHQQREVVSLLEVLILLLQHVLEHLGGHHRPLSLIAQAEVGVQVQQVASLPQQGGTEGVDGGDLCLIDQSGLSAEMAVVGVLGQTLGQLLGDAPPQLSRCRLGVGDDQKLGDVQPLAGHPVQQPLHQHPGLT